MANIVSAWTDKERVNLVERVGSGIRIRQVPARYSLFVTGVDDADRTTIARDKRVTGVSVAGVYTRVECRDRWGRKDLVKLLEGAAEAAGTADDFRILEGDVSPLRRLMSDVASLEVDPDPRLAYMDLETDTRFTFAEMREGDARILSWAVEVDGQMYSGMLVADHDDAERRLLEDLIRTLHDYGDVVLAWFGDGFDFPVLQNRCEKLGVTLNGKPIPWHRWCWMDHLELYKKYNLHTDEGGEVKSSFKLDHVAGYLLGEGKHDFDSSKTHEAWVAGGAERDRLMAYNVQDTALLARIEEATGYIVLHLAVCNICRVFPDTESLNATAQGDGFLLRLGDEHGYRWPTKHRFEGDPEPFAGAFVMPPRRLGAIENVHVCDFTGLYPAIMRTWNMSLDTKIDRPTGAHCQLPERRTYFRTDRDGMFRIALDRLVAKRGEYTAAMKAETPGSEAHVKFKRLSGAFKIVANSFYGICGSPFSRFFDKEIAEGVTQTGKWLLERVIERAEAEGLDPFYGDTDSVFVTGTDGEEFRAFVGRLNHDWDEMLEPWGIDEHHIDLDFEKTFRRLILVSAKRYAGSFAMYKGAPAPDAKPEIKGLEFKRGDTLRMARQMQTEAVHALLADDLPPAGQMRTLVEKWRGHMLEGELELEDVVISQSLSKPLNQYGGRYTVAHCTGCKHQFGSTDLKGPDTCPKCHMVRSEAAAPAHARVARVLAARGESMGEGARVRYLVIEGEKDGPMNAVPVDAEAFEKIDRRYYWDSRVYPPTQRVLEVVYPDAQWTESMTSRKQRDAESAGQINMFGGGSTAKPRTRRKKAPAKVTVTLQVGPPAEDDGKGRLTLQAVRAALEAHPGDRPVFIVIRGDLSGDGRAQRATLPIDLKVADTAVARRALERLVGADALDGFTVSK